MPHTSKPVRTYSDVLDACVPHQTILDIELPEESSFFAIYINHDDSNLFYHKHAGEGQRHINLDTKVQHFEIVELLLLVTTANEAE